ncbi:MAG: hypothetical protein DRH26_00060 [Deltaproteobacteria bacterium]|nr:MAG: hypothetical protein DRH26_00060 [Deltaproteobacteria bacterium]
MITELKEQQRIAKEAGEAMLRLSFNADYKAVNAYLQARLNDMRRRGDHLIDQDLAWNQGQCQALQFVLDLPATVKSPK